MAFMATGTVAASVLLLGSGSAPAGAEGSFRALAAADGARMTVIAVNSPGTNVPIDGGGPVAQASLDSLGTNQSFASLPYPGDAAISGPGLVAGVSNGQVTPPNYPLYVSADYPIVPEQKVEQPGYALEAKAAERETAASARSGGSSGDNAALVTSATARSFTDGDTVTGEAASLATGLAAGPLTLGRVTATASVSRRPDGTLDRKSALDITLAKVGDVPVTITPQGFTAAGSKTPLPDGSALTKSLASAGVSVKYLAGRETESGLVSPTLEVSWTHTVPGPVSPITVVWTLPRAIARIDGGGGVGGASATTAAAPASPVPPAPEAPAESGVSAVERIAATAPPMTDVVEASSSGVAMGISDDTATGGSSAGVFSGPAAPAEPSATPAAAQVLPTTRLATPATALQPPTFDVRNTFAVLALALAGAWIVSRRWRPAAAARK